jgi:hypothetical protein
MPSCRPGDPGHPARQWAEACHEQLGEADRDMVRLEQLISQAAQTLLESFAAIDRRWHAIPVDGPGAIAEEVNRAVAALQFQDLATQLLGHARKRIAVADEGLKKLTILPLTGEAPDWGAPPELSAPVGHANLDTGSVDLF